MFIFLSFIIYFLVSIVFILTQMFYQGLHTDLSSETKHLWISGHKQTQKGKSGVLNIALNIALKSGSNCSLM